MSPWIVVLLIIGIVVFAAGFFIPVKKQEASDEVREVIADEVKKQVATEMDNVRSGINAVAQEAVDYAQEKTERSLERISNEKIMAVNEYSDTVLDEINKNHKEVMFLYDMLNDKHDALMDSISLANQTTEKVKTSVAEAKTALESADTRMQEANNRVQEAEAISATALEKTREANERVAIANEKAREANEAAEIANDRLREAEKVMREFGGDQPVKQAETEAAPEFDIEQVLKADRNANGKVRTLKWAAYAQQQADVAKNELEQMANLTEEELGMFSREESALAPEVRSEEDENRDIHAEIIELHKMGKTDIEIARSLKMGVGEVKLIIGLHGDER